MEFKQVYRVAPVLFAALSPLIISACGGGGGSKQPPDPPPPPASYTYRVPADIGDTWVVADAASEGVSVPALEGIVNDVLDGKAPIVDAIAVARGGKLVLSETLRRQTHLADERVDNVELDMHVQNSASKSFASTLVGIAIGQGLIDGVDVPYLSLFPYTSYANDDARKQAIRLEDVLIMRPGLDWNEWDPPYSDPDNQNIQFYASQTDFSKGLLDLPMVAEPGAQFAYTTPASVSLGQAIENVGPLSLIDFGGTYFLAPLGITRIEVEQTPTGLPDLGRGVFLTTRDLLKLGQLYLDQGEWHGETIVTADWVSQSTTAYTDIGWSNPEGMAWRLEGYGYQWWTGSFEVDGARVESYAAWGFGEQWLMVVPAYDLVVAVNSHGQNGSNAEANQALGLIERVLLATEPAG